MWFNNKKQIINFHIEVMKIGLIEEGDKKWSDGYLPKIKETAEKYYEQTVGDVVQALRLTGLRVYVRRA